LAFALRKKQGLKIAAANAARHALDGTFFAPTMMGAHSFTAVCIMRRRASDRRRGAFTPQGAARHVFPPGFDM